MMDKYVDQPIVPTDWPPRVGQDFFGRLALLQTQDKHATPETILQKQWCMLRGQVDKIPQVTQDEQIDIQDVLKPCDSGKSIRVVVDGPPGIGKTTLCRKLLNMWAKGELTHGQYNLVLYCPLRNNKVAHASELQDILKCIYDCNEVTIVSDWFCKVHGQGLLLIFDGWDELSTDLRQSSLAARIIRREIFTKCSVIVTSRTYASSSLLEMSSVNRHVEVLGFSVKEIVAVVKGTLEKAPHLAENLIKDLEVRGDVQSLCYIPLVCSIVILVYRKSNGQLPTTLTELYENFILQTVRRHVKIKCIHNIDPRQLHSLHHLPSVLDTSVQEICQFAYLSLKEKRMTFSSFQLHESLDQSVKEDYLGLMTTFAMYDEESYQFLHLSIQEFLAAWWIAKYEKTEEVFAEHFDNDHFRMCLRFVAGLTHLEHESYQQYFNKELDLQCKWEPLFGFDVCYHSNFKQTIIGHHVLNRNRSRSFASFYKRNHVFNNSILSDELDILLFHLLYESQNSILCQILSQSIKNYSLCLHEKTLSLFDILCLGYFLNNSNITWNSLDLGSVKGQAIQLLDNMLINEKQCKRLDISLDNYHMTTVPVIKFYPYLQECYINFGWSTCKLGRSTCDAPFILLQLIQLQHLKILHFSIDFSNTSSEHDRHTDEISVFKLEEQLCINTTLHELVVTISHSFNNAIVNGVIKGVTRNKSIKTFSLTHNVFGRDQDERNSSVYIEHLLKDNNTLQALKLDIPDNYIPSLDIVEVNTPLTALKIEGSHQLISILPQHIKGLHCLILNPDHIDDKIVCQLYPLPPLFQCHPNLQQLQLTLDTAESVIELFTILQSNTTVKALKVKIWNDSTYYDSMGPSLQDMLTLNQAIEYFEIYSNNTTSIPSTYMSFLTTGLSHNTSLQELRVPIPLSDSNFEQITTLFNIISQKNELTEFEVTLVPDQCSYEERKQRTSSLFNKHGLHLITNMLQSHVTMTFFSINCSDFDFSQSSQIEEIIQHFWQTVFLHPTLQYIDTLQSPFLKAFLQSSFLEDTLQSQKKTLIDIHKQQQPLKPLPIIYI